MVLATKDAATDAMHAQAMCVAINQKEKMTPFLITRYDLMDQEQHYIVVGERGGEYQTGWGWNDPKRAWYEYEFYRTHDIPFQCWVKKQSNE